MTIRARIRKTIKWGGLVVTVLLVAVCVASVWLGGRGYLFAPGNTRIIMIGGGLVTVTHASDNRTGAGGWYWNLDQFEVPTLLVRADWVFAPWGWSISIPLWIPIALSGLITAAAWRCDTLARRRVRSSHCPKCSYDRAGIAADAPCPECGTTPRLPAQAPTLL